MASIIPIDPNLSALQAPIMLLRKVRDVMMNQADMQLRALYTTPSSTGILLASS